MAFLAPLLILSLLSEWLESVNIDSESVAYVSPDPDVSALNVEPAYFGYSMAFHRSMNSSWLLVGAPKSNSSSDGPVSPGVVQTCDILQFNASCRLSHQQYKGDFVLGAEQMFGSTLVSATNEIIACGYKKTTLAREGHRCPGACTIFGGDNSSTFTDPGDDIKYVRTSTGILQGFYFSTFAQMGFSLHISSADNRRYFGTPGIMSWRGGVFIQSGEKGCHFYGETRGRFELHGYNVASLRNDRGRPLTVLASPKYGGHGKISILSIDDDCKASLVQVINGTGFESMFGSSVLAMDVDDDGIDEIIVGSPLYNLTKGDEGAVFVYKRVGDLYEQVVILTGNGVRGSRFGTTLHSTDDVNMDGFKDLIVGSPYEGRGAIYLYLGTNETFDGEFSQRITASMLDSHLLRFGYSMQVVPLDGNSYGGLAVGAYLSDSVVVLKIRPHHIISAEISFQPPHVAWNPSNCLEFYNQTSKVNVTLVFKYVIPSKEKEKFGNRFYRDTEVSYELVIDIPHRRGFVLDEALEKFDRVRRKLTFDGAQTTVVHSWIINFDIKKQPIYASQPVNFKMNMTISKYNENIKPYFKLKYKKWSKIPFYAEPTVGHCHPDIAYELKVTRPLIVGSRSNAIISVGVRNHGDATLHTGFVLDQGPFLRLVKIPEKFIKCNTSLLELHHCELHKLLLNNSSTQFQVHLAEKDGWSGNSTGVKFSPSEGHGKAMEIELSSWYHSEIVVIKASNGSIVDDTHEVRHLYDVRNSGPGVHRKISLEIFVPAFRSLCCMNSTTEVDFKTKSLVKNSRVLDVHGVMNNKIDGKLTNIEKSSVNITCENLDCDIYSLELENMMHYDTLDVRIKIIISGSLSSFLKKFKKLIFQSELIVKPSLINETRISYDASQSEKHQLNVILKSVLVSPSGVKEVSWWLILLCLLVGIVHLVLLVLLLKKCGFFRRRGREKLEEEKNLMKVNQRESQKRDENSALDDLLGEESSQKTFM